MKEHEHLSGGYYTLFKGDELIYAQVLIVLFMKISTSILLLPVAVR